MSYSFLRILQMVVTNPTRQYTVVCLPIEFQFHGQGFSVLSSGGDCELRFGERRIVGQMRHYNAVTCYEFGIFKVLWRAEPTSPKTSPIMHTTNILGYVGKYFKSNNQYINQIFPDSEQCVVRDGRYQYIDYLRHIGQDSEVKSKNFLKNFMKVRLAGGQVQKSVFGFRSFFGFKIGGCQIIDYYHVKKAQLVPLQNPAIQPSYRNYYAQVAASVNSLLTRYSKPVTYGKQGYVEFHPQKINCTKFGFQTITEYQQVRSFQYATNSLHNMVFAVFNRLLGSMTGMTYQGQMRYRDVSDRFFRWYAVQLNKFDWSWVQTFNFCQYIDQRDYPAYKKTDYKKVIRQQFSGQRKQSVGAFKAMLKEGQVQKCTRQVLSQASNNNDFLDADGKPRAVCVGGQSAKGIFIPMMNIVNRMLKSVLPSFVQGFEKGRLQKYLHLVRDTKWKHIVTDGSMWDSTQHFTRLISVLSGLIQCTLDAIRPHLKTMLLQNGAEIQALQFEKMFRACYCCNDVFLFVPMPECYGPEWTQQMEKVFCRQFMNDALKMKKQGKKFHEHYLCIPLIDKVLSGFSIQTTDYNTLANLIDNFVILESIGIQQPWREYESYVKASRFCQDKVDAIQCYVPVNHFTLVSGDDKYTCVPQHKVHDFVASYKEHVSSTKGQKSALGIIVKKVQAYDSFVCGFLSKWCVFDGKQVYLLRDMYKAVNTKVYYRRKMKRFHQHPHLLVEAMLCGLKSEKHSRLLQEIYVQHLQSMGYNYSQQRAERNYQALVQGKCLNKYSMEFSTTDYNVEAEVNGRLGIGLYTLYVFSRTKRLHVSVALPQPPKVQTRQVLRTFVQRVPIARIETIPMVQSSERYQQTRRFFKRSTLAVYDRAVQGRVQVQIPAQREADLRPRIYDDSRANNLHVVTRNVRRRD